MPSVSLSFPNAILHIPQEKLDKSSRTSATENSDQKDMVSICVEGLHAKLYRKTVLRLKIQQNPSSQFIGFFNDICNLQHLNNYRVIVFKATSVRYTLIFVSRAV